ncbi:MAG: hypothetical protein LBQ05_02180 [Christensenellaceae bacterium]|jgi:hypothetical protein|nr:hypothetical protein [Christensenellaceae bacterium]
MKKTLFGMLLICATIMLCAIPFVSANNNVLTVHANTTNETTPVNLVDQSNYNFLQNKTISNTGAVSPSTETNLSNYMPVVAGKTYATNSYGMKIAFYDQNKNFLETLTMYIGYASAYGVDWDYADGWVKLTMPTTPVNTEIKYARICLQVSNTNACFFETNGDLMQAIPVLNTLNMVDTTDEFWVENSQLATSGQNASVSGMFHTSGYLPVQPYQNYIFNENGVYIVVYDESKNYIGYGDITGNGALTLNYTVDGCSVFNVPYTSSARFVRVIYKTTNNNPAFYIYSNPYKAFSILFEEVEQIWAIDIKLSKNEQNTDFFNTLFVDIADSNFDTFSIVETYDTFSTSTFVANSSNSIVFAIPSIFLLTDGKATNEYKDLGITLKNVDGAVVLTDTIQYKLHIATQNDDTPSNDDTQSVNVFGLIFGVLGGLLALSFVGTIIGKVTKK